MSVPPNTESEFLAALGWDAGWGAVFAPFAEKGYVPGRVGVRHKGQYGVLRPEGEVTARIKGHLRHRAESPAELPVVGDWVAIGKREHEELWRIHGVLERRTQLVRKATGLRSREQVLAANFTTVFIVTGLTEDYSPRRIERYLVLVQESGGRPALILNKADLLNPEELEDRREETLEVAGGVAEAARVHVTSALTGDGVDDLLPYLGAGETVVLVGSSGTGKSTLINKLMGQEVQRTGEVRLADGRGRHVTTQREMIRMPQGGTVIDSPGIREIQLWLAEEGFEEAFADIRELAGQCKFSNCTHTNEPGCAVLEAMEEGDLDAGRWANYLELKEELEALARRRQEIEENFLKKRQSRRKR